MHINVCGCVLKFILCVQYFLNVIVILMMKTTKNIGVTNLELLELLILMWKNFLTCKCNCCSQTIKEQKNIFNDKWSASKNCWEYIWLWIWLEMKNIILKCIAFVTIIIIVVNNDHYLLQPVTRKRFLRNILMYRLDIKVILFFNIQNFLNKIYSV